MDTPASPDPSPSPSPAYVIGVFVERDDDAASGRSALEAFGHPVVVGGPAVGGTDAMRVPSPAGLVNALWRERGTNILVIARRGDLADPTATAIPALVADPRVATVSFLHPGGPLDPGLGGTPEDLAARLRASRTAAPGPGLVPIPMASGAVVMFSASALSAVGPLLDDPAVSFEAAAAEFSFRARGRGFHSVLDPQTPTTVRTRPGADPASGLLPAEETWLLARHPFAIDFLRGEASRAESPPAMAIRSARARLRGLRVWVDGSCLGPSRAGTQTMVLAVIRALVGRDDVGEISLALDGGVPPYAAETLALPKVKRASANTEDFDVAYRPFQPAGGFDITDLRRLATRVVIAIHDLTAYEIGAYYGSSAAWEHDRSLLRAAAAEADGIHAVSADVARHLEQFGVCDEPSRVFVVHNGTDHLSGDVPAERPTDLPPVLADRPFVLAVGSNFAHKNRDLAMGAVETVRERGVDVDLVVVGGDVAHGSSAPNEHAFGSATWIHRLGEVDDRARDWLIATAAAVVYPTSAEGFGLVPFEAARLGTPPLHVAFGPLADAVSPPVVARDWSIASLADGLESLITDRAQAAAQVAAYREAATPYTWEATGAGLTQAFWAVLARPPRRDAARELEARHAEAVRNLDAVLRSPTWRVASALAAPFRPFRRRARERPHRT